MTYYPIRVSLPVLDIAKLGVCMDEYIEKFRGTRYDNTLDQEAYRAAYRIINGQPRENDERLVRAHYEATVRSDCFTQKGNLNAFFKRAVYTPRHIRAEQDAERVKRMQERHDRKIFDKLKKKYGW